MMQIMNIFLPVVGKGSIGSFALGVKGKRIREMQLTIKELEPAAPASQLVKTATHSSRRL
jgi:hypothetical protein